MLGEAHLTRKSLKFWLCNETPHSFIIAKKKRKEKKRKETPSMLLLPSKILSYSNIFGESNLTKFI
jgi:hypothetical protein